jgi:hypothetical protein
MVPLSEQVGKPLVAPVPAAALTPPSTGAFLVEVPWALFESLPTNVVNHQNLFRK